MPDVTNATVLIDPLRRHLGDVTAPYTYSDVVLSGYILDGIKAVGSRWANKYYVATYNSVPNQILRTPEDDRFDFSSPPVIQYLDERIIVLQASIIIKSSKKFNESSNAVSWRDEEISFSSIEAARQRSLALADDIAELDKLLPIRLARPGYGRLYGWGAENKW
jgi:hypothetical protein